MSEKAKINKMALKFGLSLINTGSNIARNAFKSTRILKTSDEMRGFLAMQGIESISLSDQKYYLTDIDEWKEIIAVDLLDRKEYKSDFADCDNFAFLFASRASHITGLNTAGVAYGAVYDKETGKHLGNHAFNLIIVENNGIMYAYLYEPMNDSIVLWDRKGNNVLKDWTYSINWILMF